MSIQTVKVLLDGHGRQYAEEAGIRLADRPGPLYQLLVLSTLLSARINASVAVAAARELFAAGYTTRFGRAGPPGRRPGPRGPERARGRRGPRRRPGLLMIPRD